MAKICELLNAATVNISSFLHGIFIAISLNSLLLTIYNLVWGVQAKSRSRGPNRKRFAPRKAGVNLMPILAAILLQYHEKHLVERK